MDCANAAIASAEEIAPIQGVLSAVASIFLLVAAGWVAKWPSLGRARVDIHALARSAAFRLSPLAVEGVEKGLGCVMTSIILPAMVRGRRTRPSAYASRSPPPALPLHRHPRPLVAASGGSWRRDCGQTHRCRCRHCVWRLRCAQAAALLCHGRHVLHAHQRPRVRRSHRVRPIPRPPPRALPHQCVCAPPPCPSALTPPLRVLRRRLPHHRQPRRVHRAGGRRLNKRLQTQAHLAPRGHQPIGAPLHPVPALPHTRPHTCPPSPARCHRRGRRLRLPRRRTAPWTH